MTLYHETASTSPSRVAPISKRSLIGLLFVFVHFRKENPRVFRAVSCPTKIHSSEHLLDIVFPTPPVSLIGDFLIVV